VRTETPFIVRLPSTGSKFMIGWIDQTERRVSGSTAVARLRSNCSARNPTSGWSSHRPLICCP
jgi:hypothetical protein